MTIRTFQCIPRVDGVTDDPAPLAEGVIFASGVCCLHWLRPGHLAGAVDIYPDFACVQRLYGRDSGMTIVPGTTP